MKKLTRVSGRQSPSSLLTDEDRAKITNDGKGAAKYYVLKGLLAFETLLEQNQPKDSTFCLLLN